MKNYVNLDEITSIEKKGHFVYPLLNDENGCVAGCNVCIGCYTDEEYVITGAHEDQEIFYVLEGTGTALVGEQEINLKPGTCFLVKPGNKHGIKKDKDCEYVKALFFHAAV